MAKGPADPSAPGARGGRRAARAWARGAQPLSPLAAEKRGFRVERGVAGMPTAFVASYGQGRPVIAVLGEYDALPGLSQKAVPERAPLEAGAAGHGCGHNLFGPPSPG